MSSYLKTLLNFWLTAVFYYVFMGILVDFVYKSFGAGLAIVAFLILAFFHIQWWRNIKTQLLNGLPNEYQYLPGDIDEDFTPFDTDLIRQYMQELENQSFVYFRDVKLAPGRVGSLSFARLYSHPEHHCLAEVFQVFYPGQEPSSVTLSIHSYFDNERTFSSTQSKPNGFSYMWRNNHSLWRYYPSAMPAQLLQYHLRDRQEIMEKLRVGLVPVTSWEFYEEEQQQSAKIRRQTFKRKNIFLSLIEATLFEIKPASQWLGDYGKIANLK